MVSSQDKHFQAVQAFHHLMDGSLSQKPEAFSFEQVLHRADFKLEEILEMVHATAQNVGEFEQGLSHLHTALDRASAKILSKAGSSKTIPLIGQVDALMDLLYFTYGSFALIGVDPEPIFQLVHEANMGKIWPDGKAHHDPVTNKILKPENWERDFAPEAKILAELNRQLEFAQANHASKNK